MSWFKNLFKKKEEIRTTPYEPTIKWDEGYPAFEEGRKLFINKEYEEALTFFDLAIALEYDKYENRIYGTRAICLQHLKYNLESIEDFDRAIVEEPDDFNLYFSRSISKKRIRDYIGEIEDLKKALELYKKDSKLNRGYQETDIRENRKSFSEVYDAIRGRLLIAEGGLEENIKMEKVFHEIELNPTEEYLILIQNRKDAFKRRTKSV